MEELLHPGQKIEHVLGVLFFARQNLLEHSSGRQVVIAEPLDDLGVGS